MKQEGPIDFAKQIISQTEKRIGRSLSDTEKEAIEKDKYLILEYMMQASIDMNKPQHERILPMTI